MFKVKHGNDFVVDKDWKPKLFSSIEAVINFANRTMPKDLKALGFGVGIWQGNEYIRFSYGRKC